MGWLCVVVGLLLFAAQAQEEQPSDDNRLQQHEAMLEGTFAEQAQLQSLEQAQQAQQMAQVSSFLTPQPRALFSTANLPASELGAVMGSIGADSSVPTFVSDGVMESSITGLPSVPLNQAVMQFVQHQQQIQQQQQQQQQQATQLHDLEAGGNNNPTDTKGPKPDAPAAPWFGLHKAVPKLQQWLTAMDPMSYSGPTFTNPVAKQVLKKLANPKLPLSERQRLQRLVSSPYMFNMLGNPAFEDPQLWGGLVSGAAVPYPLRNVVMAQRTEIPFRIGSTGDAMTDLDHVSVNEYSKLLQGTAATPGTPTHKARHRIFKIIQHLNQARTAQLTSTLPIPHKSALAHTFEVVDNPHNFYKTFEGETAGKKGEGEQAGKKEEEDNNNDDDSSLVGSEEQSGNLGVKDFFGGLA